MCPLTLGEKKKNHLLSHQGRLTAFCSEIELASYVVAVNIFSLWIALF